MKKSQYKKKFVHKLLFGHVQFIFWKQNVPIQSD